nr:hypothetical protein [uncultured bacterium]
MIGARRLIPKAITSYAGNAARQRIGGNHSATELPERKE